MWYSVQENERPWKSFCNVLEQQLNNLQFINTVLRKQLNYVVWEVQNLRGFTEVRVHPPWHPLENDCFPDRINTEGNRHSAPPSKQTSRVQEEQENNMVERRGLRTLWSVPVTNQIQPTHHDDSIPGTSGQFIPTVSGRPYRPQEADYHFAFFWVFEQKLLAGFVESSEASELRHDSFSPHLSVFPWACLRRGLC